MNAKITFSKTKSHNKIVLKKVTSVHIESSWKRLTDTAIITIPRNVIFIDDQKIKLSIKDVNRFFKKGDPVCIELGYNGQFYKEFEGYVTEVSADIPIVIKCEDEMYQLKKKSINISLEKATLKGLLTKILPGYDMDILEGTEIGDVIFPNKTVPEALEYLRDELGLYSYFKGKQLVSGKIYQDDAKYYKDNPNLKPIKLHLEKNVVNNDLNYRNKEDVLIKIIAISMQTYGDKLQVEVGDKYGLEKKLQYPMNITVKAELTKAAERDLKKFKIDGFTGSITAYGIPVINHGNKVDLVSDLYPDRNGLYYVEEKVIDFDENGFRRKVQLGDKVAV